MAAGAQGQGKPYEIVFTRAPSTRASSCLQQPGRQSPGGKILNEDGTRRRDGRGRGRGAGARSRSSPRSGVTDPSFSQRRRRTTVRLAVRGAAAARVPAQLAVRLRRRCRRRTPDLSQALQVGARTRGSTRARRQGHDRRLQPRGQRLLEAPGRGVRGGAVPAQRGAPEVPLCDGAADIERTDACRRPIEAVVRRPARWTRRTR